MIGEIAPSPLEARTTSSRIQLGLRVAAYSIGLIGSTTAVGATAGSVGSVVSRTATIGGENAHLWSMVVAIIALTCGMHEVAIIRLPFPDIFRQVPAEWRKYGRNVQALLYGLVLGMDLLTFVPYASFLVLLPLEALLGLKGGATLGAIYGLTRAALTLWGVLAAYRRRDAFSVAIRISRMTRVFHLLNGIALAVVGEVLVGAALFAR